MPERGIQQLVVITPKGRLRETASYSEARCSSTLSITALNTG